jgi:hypothetical protein
LLALLDKLPKLRKLERPFLRFVSTLCDEGRRLMARPWTTLSALDLLSFKRSFSLPSLFCVSFLALAV